MLRRTTELSIYPLADSLACWVVVARRLLLPPQANRLQVRCCRRSIPRLNLQGLLGFKPADIVVTARNDLLDNQPVAKKLFEVATIEPIAVAQMITRVQNQEDPEDLALEWIADNSELVDGWLAEARAAA